MKNERFSADDTSLLFIDHQAGAMELGAIYFVRGLRVTALLSPESVDLF